MNYISAKTILTSSKDYGNKWFGIDYNMNLYRGCNHGCIYCDSRSLKYRVENFDEVRIKKDCIDILESELSKKRRKGVVGIGAMSDSYNPYEKKYNITKQALELLHKYNFGISLETKSDLILRDIDILNKINKNSDCIIKFTITTSNDDIARKIEPFASSSSQRFKAVEKLSREGIFSGVLMTPILPFINDNEENIIGIVEKSKNAGAKFIYGMFGVTLRDIQKNYYFEKINIEFPNAIEKYNKYYNGGYAFYSRDYKRLNYIFKNECEKHGLLYRMEDIIKAYKKSNDEDFEQLSLI